MRFAAMMMMIPFLLTGCLATTHHTLEEVAVKGLKAEKGKLVVVQKNGGESVFDAPSQASANSYGLQVFGLYPQHFPPEAVESVDVVEDSMMRSVAVTTGVVGAVAWVICFAFLFPPGGFIRFGGL